MITNAVIDFFINTKKAQKELENLKTSFLDVKNSLFGKTLGLSGSFLGLSSLKQAYQQVKQLGDLSNKFQLPIEQVSKFNNVLSMFGGNAETTTNSINSIEQALVEFKTTGQGAFKTIGATIGLTLQRADGSFKNSIEIIEELRNKFKGLNNSAKIKVAQQLGIDSPAMLNLLKASDKEYSNMVAEASKMNIINGRQKRIVQETVKTLGAIKQSLVGIGTTLLDFLNPALVVVKDLLYKFNGLPDEIKKIVAVLMTVAPLLSGVLKSVKLITGAFGALNLQALAIVGTIYGAYKLSEKLVELFNDKFAQKVMSEDYEKEQLEKINERREKRGLKAISWEDYQKTKENNSTYKSVLKDKELSTINNNYNSFNNGSTNNKPTNNNNITFNINGGDTRDNLNKAKNFLNSYGVKQTLAQTTTGAY